MDIKSAERFSYKFIKYPLEKTYGCFFTIENIGRSVSYSIFTMGHKYTLYDTIYD